MGRFLGAIALVVGAVTLVLEVLARGSLGWWLFVPILVVQAAMLVRLALFLAVAGPQAGDRRPPLTDAQAARVIEATEVAVIATGESTPTVRTALIAALDAVPAERVLLVSADERHAELARRVGVRWVRAEEGWHAGVDAAVTGATATFLAITAASTAVVARTLHAIARYIDRTCAWVQTSAVSPEQRRPVDHVEHLVVGPAIDSHRAAAWTGAGSLVQVAAIRAVGVRHGTLGATIALQSRGWHGRGVRGTLTLPQGDPSVASANERAVDDMMRRLRLLASRRSPLWARRLPWRARVAHLRTLVDDLAGVVYAVAAITMVLALLVGRLPVPLTWPVLAGLVATQVFAVVSRWKISTGLLRPGGQLVDAAEALPVSISAATRAVGLPVRRPAAHDDTQTRDRRAVRRARRVTLAFVVALETAVVMRAVVAIVDRNSAVRGVDLLVLVAGVITLVPLLVAAQVIVRARYLRASRRAPAPMPAVIGAQSAEVVDLSADGIGLVTATPVELLSTVVVRLLPGDRAPIDLRCQVVHVRADERGARVGLRLVGGLNRRATDDFVRLWIDRVSHAPIEWPRVQPLPARRVARGSRGIALVRLASVVTLVSVGLANLPPYTAATASTSDGGLVVRAEAADAVLYGADLAATVSVCNETGATVHRVAVRTVLPAGVAALPAALVPAPDRSLVDQPVPGATTVLWEELGDLVAGSCLDVALAVSHQVDPAGSGGWRVGDRIDVTVEAFASTTVATPVEFAASGVVATTASSTQRMGATGFSATIEPLGVTTGRSDGTTAVLRGVHTQASTYEVRIVNNPLVPTEAVVVDQYLPSGIEFLGCGGVDLAPPGVVEYPQAPRLDGTAEVGASCLEPAAVNLVVVDPDGAGPLRAGPHTQVRWELGTMAPGAEQTLAFAAGVAARHNEVPAPRADGSPTASSAAATLADNTGASTAPSDGAGLEQVLVSAVTATSTGRPADEQPSRLWASTLTPLHVVDVTSSLAACNDAAVVVGDAIDDGCSTGVAHGGTTDWTLAVATGEYRALRDPTVTVTLSDGLELAPDPARLTIGTTTVDLGATSLGIAPDGTQTATWSLGTSVDPAVLEQLVAADSTWQLTFTTTTLSNHRSSGQPVAAFDELVASARLDATGVGIRADADQADLSLSTTATDRLVTTWTGAAAQPALRLASAETLAAIEGGEACTPPLAPPSDGGAPLVRPGSLTCFEVSWSMPDSVAVRDPSLVVQLPATSALEWFGTRADQRPASIVLVPDAVAPTSTVRFDLASLGAATSRFVAAGQVVQMVIGVRNASASMLNGATDHVISVRPTVAGGGGTDSIAAVEARTRVALPRPVVSTSVVGIVRAGEPLATSSSSSPTALAPLIGGDEVTVRLQVANTGIQSSDPDNPEVASADDSGRQPTDASATELVVALPAGSACDGLVPVDPAANLRATLAPRPDTLALSPTPSAQLSAVSCTGSTLRFRVATLPAGYDLRADFTLAVPEGVGAGTALNVVGGVASFSDAAGTQLVPERNVDPTLDSAANWPAATSTLVVDVADATHVRTFTTDVVDGTSNSATEATIGETVTSSYTFTLPAGTAVYSPEFTVSLPAGLDHLESSARVQSSPFAPATWGSTNEPAGWTLADDENGWRLTGPTDDTGWRNDTGRDQSITVQYRARVLDVASNVAGTELSDVVTANWSLAPGGPADAAPSPVVGDSLVLVEPALTITEQADPIGPLRGGEALSTTLTVAAGAGGADAHDVEVEACAAAGLTSVVPTAPTEWIVESIPGGCAAGGTAVRFATPSLAAGDTATLSYTATTVAPAAAGSAFAIASTVRAGSLDGEVDGERSYRATAADEVVVAVAEPSFGGTASVSQVAPGAGVDHVFTFTVPARTRVFDATVVTVASADLSVTGSPGTAPAYGPTCSVPGTVGHAITPVGQTAAWFLGDVVAGDVDCVITMGLSTRADTTASGDTAATVSATAEWGSTDLLSDVTEASTSGLEQNLTATTSVSVVTPSVSIARSVDDDDRQIEGGQAVTHTVTLTNTGSSTAYHIDVIERLPAGLTGTDTFGGTCENAGTPTATTESLTWTLFTGLAGLVPDASCTLTYVARTAAATTLDDDQELESTSTVGDYFGVIGHADLAAAERTTYTGFSSSLTLTATRPTLRIDLTAADGGERAATGLGEPSAWTARVANLSTGGARTARGVDLALTLPPNWSFTDVLEVQPERCAAFPSFATTDNVTTVTWSNMCDLAPGEELELRYRVQSQLGAVATPGLVAANGSAVVHEQVMTLSAEDAGGTTLGSATNTAGATIEAVDLAVVTTDASAPGDGAPTSPGMVLGVPSSYFVDTRNNGPAAVTGTVTVTDTVPAGFLVTSATGTGWTCAVTATVVCTHPGPAPAGTNLPRITITGIPTDAALNDADGDGNPATGLAVNRVSVSSAQVDHRAANDNDDEPTPVRRVTDMAISAVWSPDTPLVAGAEVRAAVTVVSAGPSAGTGEVRVIDELPTGMRLVRVSGVGWNCGASRVGRGFSAELADNGVVNCVRRLVDLAPGAGLDPLDVVVQIDPAVMSATSLQATVVHANDPEPGNNVVTTAAPTPSAVLSVRLDDGGDRFAVGQRDAHITVVATNQGPSPEVGPVELEVSIPAGAVPGAVDATGWSCVTEGPSAAGTSLVRCTFVGDDDEPDRVLVGQMLPAVDIVMEIEAEAVRSVDPAAENPLRTSASLTGSTAADAATAELDTPVEPRADVVATVDPVGDDAWVAGAEESYAVVVTNRGPSAEYGPVVVTVPLPLGVAYRGAEGDGWTCLADRGGVGLADIVTCTADRPTSLDDDEALLDPGDDLDTLVLDVGVGSELLPTAAAEVRSVEGSFTSVGTTDATPSDGSFDTEVVAVADLALVRSGAPGSVAVGDTASYEWQVTNAGPNPSAAGVVVTDELPPGLALVAWTGTGWTCAAQDAVVRCESSDVLDVGDSTAVRLSVRAAPEAYDDGAELEAAARLEAVNRDPRLADNEVSYTVAIDPLVDLAVATRVVDRLVVGRTVTMEYLVANAGPNNPESVITLTGDLPEGLRLVAVDGSGWECLVSGQRFDCTRESRVGTGDPLPMVTADVVVESLSADGTNTVVSVSAPHRDADTGNNVRIDTVTVMPADSRMPVAVAEVPTAESEPSPPVVVADDAPTNVALAMSMSGSVQLGQRSLWTLEVTNDGAEAAYEVVVRQVVAPGLQALAADAPGGRCVVAASTVTCAFESLSSDERREVRVVATAFGVVRGGAATSSATVGGSRPETRDDDNSVTLDVAVGAARAGGSTAGGDASARAAERGVDLPAGWAVAWVTLTGICGLLLAVGLTVRVVVRPRRRRAAHARS